ncbi:protein phosphatase 2C domain-containing protein [Streptomyces polygonati]|uniref:Protein phosphatase 2C domain-containing protein n=1 Tax=Streptomyces polygonati TaxID=1617087 RepID=A0ABV8HMK4_9ACTN
MTEVADGPAWTLLQGAVKGRNKKYTQDSWAARKGIGGDGVLLVVADGHGSKAHYRSDLGSRWAVEAFIACAEVLAQDVARRGGDESHWPAVLAAARGLPQQIVHHWRHRVAMFEANSPADGTWPRARGAGLDTIPYGSTLVGAIVVGRLLLCWKLGDGDIVLVDETGEPFVPLYDGPELGDEADSLCQAEAWRQMRIHWQRLPADRHTAVLISTDGLSKSFTDHSGFVSFAEGLRDRARDQGLDVVQGQLASWLERAASFSGDDSTLVGAFPSERYAPTADAGRDRPAPAQPSDRPGRQPDPPHQLDTEGTTS